MKKKYIIGYIFFTLTIALLISASYMLRNSESQIKFVNTKGDAKVINNLNILISNDAFLDRSINQSGETNTFLVRDKEFVKLKQASSKNGKISLKYNENKYNPISDIRDMELQLENDILNNKKNIVFREDNSEIRIPIVKNSILYSNKIIENNQVLAAAKYNGKIYTLIKSKGENKQISDKEVESILYLVEINDKEKSYSITKKIKMNYPLEEFNEGAIVGPEKVLHYCNSQSNTFINTIDVNTGSIVTEKISKSEEEKDGFKSKANIAKNEYKFFDSNSNKYEFIRLNEKDKKYYIFKYRLIDGKLNLVDYKSMGISKVSEEYTIAEKKSERFSNIHSEHSDLNHKQNEIDIYSFENFMKVKNYMVFYQNTNSSIHKNEHHISLNGFRTIYVYDTEKNRLVFSGDIDGDSNILGNTMYTALTIN
ncbi:hypothetical protein [Peptostreptococcus faecalis]|uniref:hypothetical protein n=1 Tax=Peptostreptococcus faecalis TaxID=2045015 RepID=UPI000C7E330D|nr:hypothetical protein [Peptostreptococcus faecalis]